MIWKRIMLLHGARAEKQIFRIVKCFVKRITDRRATGNIALGIPHRG